MTHKHSRHHTSEDQQLLPPRIRDRPHADLWGEDELLTLREAAALLWPDGPLTTRSLRTAVHPGQLATVTIARKMLTTRRHLGRMGECQNRSASPSQGEPRESSSHLRSPHPTFEQLVAARLRGTGRRSDGD